MKLFLLVIAIVLNGVSRAAEHSGKVSIGAFESTEKFETSVSGTKSNDQSLILGSVLYKGREIDGPINRITLDFRDRYNKYGTLDDTGTKLSATNEPQLRQLSATASGKNKDLEVQLGRFPIANASLLGNDGVNITYKSNAHSKFGLFGGLKPEHQNGRTVKLDQEDSQIGIYSVYENHSKKWRQNAFATTALVYSIPNKNKEFILEQESASTTVENDSSGDSDDSPNPDPSEEKQKFVDEAFWYTQAVYQPSINRRFFFLSYVNITPDTNIRNLSSSWYEKYNKTVSSRLSILRLDLKEYERRKDLRDRLPSSIYDQMKLNGRYQSKDNLLLEADVTVGRRELDNKSRNQLLTKFGRAKMFSDHLSLFTQFGFRQNFSSKDKLMRFGITYFGDRFEVDLLQQFSEEEHEDGKILRPIITDFSLSGLLSKKLILATHVQYAKDEEVRIISGLLTLNYRFSSVQLVPVRDSSVPVERL